jgi:acetyltransferase-like isoleucine patch superfamily enzyme
MNFLKTHFYFKRNSKISKSAQVYWLSKITDSYVSDYTYIGPLCDINNCNIGKFCSISNSVKIGMGLHPTNFISTSPLFYSPINPLKTRIVNQNLFNEYKKVNIGNDVWIGSSVIILDGITIGDGAIIGANAVVSKNVENYSIVAGVPAKEIKKRFSIEIIESLEKLRWWNYSIEKLKEESALGLFSKEFGLKDLAELSNRLNNDK